ncbi:hypothetical protein HYH03_009740 [Edaphochlamys debaryana]|uniref:Uncharacterized protein n=1 Tax=Edaphochlamys debaryana TaxID=47281 RepID=A0A836BWZ3_9CHLO|nr:hypothetical protein HYH03_009740 [Edaphochlamys debaryana]|eukprot:KAG2492010.1 hypothetical protein HYH03_009740 [Edaphochlamys debaryana]
MMVVCAQLAVAVIEPLGLHNVRLSDFSLSARYERMVTQYLLETLADTDRLLLTYRLNAGLPTNDAEPYWGSWEAPDVEIRGKFMGHYLTSLSQAWATTGTPAFRERLRVMVSELSRVQAALGGGYLSAFPEEHFDRLEALEPVWAPYYAIHKIIAGLVDSYELAGVEEALPMALKAVAYHWNRTQAVIAKYGITRWYDILDVEFGGMNEILYRIYGITKDKTHLEFAKLFDKPVFRKPLEVGTDILAGLHANTHLQQVNGFAMAYDIVGDVAARNATRNFFDIIVNGHSYATGGSSVYEGWFPPYQVSDAIWSERNALMTEETCTQYNILKVSRALFRWTGNVSYADFYERALLNGILGTARVPDPAEGGAFHHHDHSHSHHGHDHHLSDFLPSSGSAAAASARQGAAQHTQHAARRALAESRSGRGHGLSGSGASRIASSSAAREGAQQGQAWSHVVAPQRRERPGADLADDRHPSLGRFQDLPPGSNATNDPGPGVFLYLLPLGSGQSKADNGHHWGYPLNSFWCCYGTAVESYTKLADSIFFKDLHPTSGPAESHGASTAAGSSGVALPPRLYVNQFVSSRAAFHEGGLSLTMDADMYSKGPAGPAASARIKFEALKASSGFTEDPMARPQPQACHSKPGSGAGPHGACTFTLMLRIPSWVAPPPAAPTNETAIVVTVNGQPWTNCPKEAKPGSYCEITRDWAPGDVVYARLPMRWWLNELPENRAQFKGLQAVMMGPFLMAGITHAERQLTLPAPPPKPKPGPAPPVDPSAILAANTWPVDESVNRLSLQASWDADLHVRLDKHLLFMAELVDAGDKMDATFRAVKPCHKALLPATETPGAGAGAGAVEGGAAGGAAELRRSVLEGGQADAAIALESMSYPDHYMTYDRSNKIVFAPVSSFAPGGCDPVSLWIIRPGLDGSSDTVSFESVGRPGWFVSAEACPCLAACADEGPAELCTPEVCERDAHAARVSCRGTCGLCLPACSALSLSQRSSPSAASFRLTSPARRAYPDGSYVLAGDNRHYLLAPLGNIVDERYTAYFDLGRK